VLKHVDAAELGIVSAAILTVAADAMLVAQHLSKLGTKKQPGGGSTREIKGGGSGET
jgi:hypothetical protein